MRMAKIRPQVPIIAVCYDIEVARYLNLVWGTYPIIIQKDGDSFDIRKEINKACTVIRERGFATETDLLTITAGLPFGIPGVANIIRITSAAGANFWFDEKDPTKLKFIEGND